MKAVTYAALFMGVLTTALAQTLPPSPTASVGCVPHGDHWDCDGPRVTDGATGPAITTGPAPTTAHHDDDDHDHDHDHDHTDDESDHESGTGSLKPSPTESYGCEAHGDHWHCEGHVTASRTSAPSTLAADAASTSTSTSTGGAAQATGLGIAGVVAVIAMAL